MTDFTRDKRNPRHRPHLLSPAGAGSGGMILRQMGDVKHLLGAEVFVEVVVPCGGHGSTLGG